MARRRKARYSRRRKIDTVWWGFQNVAAIAVSDSTQIVELIPDAMTGSIVQPLSLLRLVGDISVTPQGASSATSLLSIGIVRTRHSPTGAVLGSAEFDPASTDVDSFAQDWLYRRSGRPRLGGPLDASALDMADRWEIDLKGRPSLRKMEKMHGLQLVHIAGTTAQLNITINFRILIGIK